MLLFPREEERASNPPPLLGVTGRKVTGMNLQESPKQGKEIFGVKRGNSLVRNQHFNAPRGERYFDIKMGISSLKFLA